MTHTLEPEETIDAALEEAYDSGHDDGYAEGYAAADNESREKIAEDAFENGARKALRDIEPVFSLIAQHHNDNHSGPYVFCYETLCREVQEIERSAAA